MRLLRRRIMLIPAAILVLVALLLSSVFAAEQETPPEGSREDYVGGSITMAPAESAGTTSVTWPSAGEVIFEYDLQHDTNGMFNVLYTPYEAGSGTDRTVLVISWPEYGTRLTACPIEGMNSVRSITFPDSHTAVIALEDNVTEQCTFGFTLEAACLTDAQAARWIDCGDMTTGYTAAEYRLNEGYSAAQVLEEGAAAAFASFAGTAMVPKAYSTVAIAPTGTGSYLHTYHVGVSSVPYSTDYILKNVGGYWSSDGHLLSGSRQNAGMRWDIPTAHSDQNPLIEITKIRIYVPDERLELTGIKRVTDTIGNNLGSDLNTSQFHQQWNGWTVSERQYDSEKSASYYELTPAQRWFNIGISGSLASEYFGFVPTFQLIDESEPLDYSDTAETHYYAQDTVISYKQAGADGEQVYTQAGPEVYTWIRKSVLPSTAYNSSRYKKISPISNQNVVIGSTRVEEEFTLFDNQYYVAGSTGAKTEYVPEYNGDITMHYSFPAEIKPFSVQILPHAAWGDSRATDYFARVLSSVAYQTEDGVWHTVPQSEIEAANAVMKTFSTSSNSPKQKAAVFQFTGASEANRVTELEIKWEKLYTDLRLSYWNAGLGTPAYNKSNGSLSDSAAISGICFTYVVGDKDENGDPVQQYDTCQVKYTLSYGETEQKNDNYLYFRLIDELCPTLKGTYAGSSCFNLTYLDDRETVIGSVSLFVGTYGEYKDDLVNPVIDLAMKIRNQQYPGANGAVNNTTMPDEDALAFFTGKFTAMPKLSGWVCEYTTLLHPEGLSWTIPEITDEAGQTVQIPLAEGDYFKTLSVRYSGTVSFPHTGPEDARSLSYVLMDDITIRRIGTDPFTGTEIDIGSGSIYSSFYVSLYGYLRFENCSCDTHLHSEGLGQLMNSSNSVTVPASTYYPCQALFRRRQATFTYSGITGTITEGNTTQGGTTSFSYVPLIKHNQSQAFRYNYLLKPYPNSATNATGGIYPFDIDFSVYVELVDNDFTVDLAGTKLMGVAADSGNVLAEEITVSGRRFLKLSFAEGFYQPRAIDENYTYSYPASFRSNPDYMTVSHSYGDYITDTIQISLTALPNARIGEHYPIGKVYYDYSALLEQYDAPNVTGSSFPEGTYSSKNDYNMTNYLFVNAVPDEYGLSSSVTSETDKLFVTDLSEGSPNAWKTNVAIASVTGAGGYPGKNGLFDIIARVTDFTEPETEKLNGLTIITGSSTNTITDFEAYVRLPRRNEAVTYISDSGSMDSAVSDITFEMRGSVNVKNLNGVEESALHISYTTDPDPKETSVYMDAASVTDWSAVTGFKVVADKIDPEGAVLMDLDLRTEKKTSLEILKAYMGGSYHYVLQGITNSGLMPLSTWTYANIPVTGVTGGLIYWDTYNENGTKGTSGNEKSCEAGIGGIPVSLYDAEGRLIMSTATSTASATLGTFALESWKSDAGQYIVIGEPSAEGVTVKLTKNSSAQFYQNQYDSDFDRNAAGTEHILVLPELTKTGFSNIGAGFVKLPKITAPDITLHVGETKDLEAVLGYYLGMALPAASYNLSFENALDGSIAEVEAADRVLTTSKYYTNSNFRSAAASVSVTGKAKGDTAVRISTVTAAGDTVEVLCNIHVLDTSLTISKTVEGNGGDKNKVFRFTITLEPALSGTFSGVDFTDGTAVILLSHGESKTITGLPEGTAYTVTEDDYSAEGYVTLKSGDTGTLRTDTEQTAAFVNTRTAYGSLRISKTVTGAPEDLTKDFTFRVEFSTEGSFAYSGSKTGTLSSGDTVTLRHGESILIEGILAGTSYTVTESDAEGFLVEANGFTGIIPDSTTAEASFRNIRSKLPETADGLRLLTWLCLFSLSVLGMLTAVKLNGKRR